jgi:hypothetical protein
MTMPETSFDLNTLYELLEGRKKELPEAPIPPISLKKDWIRS